MTNRGVAALVVGAVAVALLLALAAWSSASPGGAGPSSVVRAPCGDPDSWACACAGATAKTPLLFETCRLARPYRGVLVVGLTSAGNLELTTNWLTSLHRVGFDLRHVVLLCADRVSHEHFRANSIAAVRLSPRVWEEVSAAAGWKLEAPEETTNTLSIYSRPYLLLVKNRLAVLHYLLLNGASVLFHDVDLVYLKRHPHGVDRAIDLLTAQPNKTMLMMHNRKPEEYVEYNMGYFLVRPSLEALTLFSALNTYMFDTRMRESEIDDQNLFNDYVLGTKYNLDTVHLRAVVGGLPYEEFTPGRTTFANSVWPPTNGPMWPLITSNWSAEHDAVTPAVIHANWILSYEKPPRMREYRIFFSDDPALVHAAGLDARPTPTPPAVILG